MFAYAKPEQKQATKSTIQKKESEKVVAPNQTGIPDGMKSQFEHLSGFSFDDVRVHYNSDKPAQLQALAYTQGSQVYVAPGQEKHLGHELGHVVQQKAGIVRATANIDGLAVNEDVGLEIGSDLLAKKVLQMKKAQRSNNGVYQFGKRKKQGQKKNPKNFKGNPAKLHEHDVGKDGQRHIKAGKGQRVDFYPGKKISFAKSSRMIEKIHKSMRGKSEEEIRAAILALGVELSEQSGSETPSSSKIIDPAAGPGFREEGSGVRRDRGGRGGGSGRGGDGGSSRGGGRGVSITA